MKKRTFTKTIFYPAGANSAGVYEEKVTLDAQYDRATGVAAYVNKGGGLPTFQLGLRNDSQVYVQPTNVAYFQADASCPKNQRMTAVQIMCDKTETTIVLVLPAGNTEDFSLDVVFELEG